MKLIGHIFVRDGQLFAEATKLPIPGLFLDTGLKPGFLTSIFKNGFQPLPCKGYGYIPQKTVCFLQYSAGLGHQPARARVTGIGHKTGEKSGNRQINGLKLEVTMSHELINLTLPIVIQEIEDVLEDYPEHPYQAAFLMPELRLQLIAHVLSQIPNRYEVKGIQKSSNNAQARHSSPLQERLRTEMVIRGSILHILSENADWLSHQLPKG